MSAISTFNQCVVHCVGMGHAEDPGYRWNHDFSASYGLIPEPNNPHDPNAIKVVRKDHDDKHLGYIAREFAPGVLHILEQGQLLSVNYASANSNSYRRVLHLHFISPALVHERNTVKRLTEELQTLLVSGEHPQFVSSLRKKRKSVSFADPVSAAFSPAEPIAEPLAEPHHVHAPDGAHEHGGAGRDVERTNHE